MGPIRGQLHVCDDVAVQVPALHILASLCKQCCCLIRGPKGFAMTLFKTDISRTSRSQRRTKPSSPAESRVLFRSVKTTLLMRLLKPSRLCRISSVCSLVSSAMSTK